MSEWDTLIGTALVGTGRRPPPADLLAGVVAPGTLPVDGTEATVLASAAVLGTRRRAGWLPPAWQGTPRDAAAADDRPECSAAAAQLLELLLDRSIRVDGGNEPLIAYWLHACEAAGHRPPAQLVVPLLQAGTTVPELREAVRSAAGARGGWLGTHNRRWAWAVPADVAGAAGQFGTATRAERLALLATLREVDPQLARGLVEQTWTAEQAASRAALVDTLAIGLSDADEPFLESVLDDRAPTVRAAAAALLDRLPHSRRAARMAQRVRALTRQDSTIELPGEPDAAARRDGITDRREPGHGLHASWLIQIVGAAPLQSPPGTTALRQADPAVIAGWTKAALRQQDIRWLTALAQSDPTAELLRALPPEVGTRIVSELSTVDARFAALLAACPGPWPATFSSAVIERLRTVRTDRVLATAFPGLAQHLDTTALTGVESWLAETSHDSKARRRTLRSLAHALTIRSAIDQEFS
ncbi:DUF5691 domain-containing protein [Saccharomonospora sp. NPDC046836]|uniref:DUF5691 domain-containing protein n=1 Tax=Saccharomonospora sp. NPDC046836 TaxID=3156921 RepID=UPI0034018EA0